MNRMYARILSVLLVLTSFYSVVYAGGKKQKAPRIAPKAILVRINTEQNRTRYLEQKGDKHKLELLREAANSATAAMIHDFSDHFNFCLVYYFYDTNLHDILDGNYSVLMNADLKPAGSTAVIPGRDEVKIVYFGYADVDRHIVPEGAGSTDPDAPEAKRYDKVYGIADHSSNSKALEAGLVMRNGDFKEDRTDERFYIGRNRSMDAFRDHRYSYSSTQFSIDYVRSAKRLNGLLTEYYTSGSK